MSSRYNRVAMSLHWLIALAIIGNLALGWWMHDAIEQSDTRALATLAFQWHKSIGLSVLLLSILRLLWRLTHTPPALPSNMKTWERLAAQATHVVFYGLMLLVPLSGWLYVSTQWRGDAALSVPTLWFGWFDVPHLFGLNHASDVQRQWWADISLLSHDLLTQALAGLLLLHVAAALKHQFLSHDDVLLRMLPSSGRGWVVGCSSLLVIGFSLVGLNRFGASSDEPLSVDIQSSASGWSIQADESAIEFSGVHADDPFRGRFTRWSADLQLYPDNPGQSTLTAHIQTGSARDGQVLHEETLPQAEWFDIKNHPQAIFTSSRIEATDSGAWVVFGSLKIKDRSVAIGPMQLQLTQTQATLNAEITIDRADFNLGMDSDPKGEWVSRQIGITLRLLAFPPQ